MLALNRVSPGPSDVAQINQLMGPIEQLTGYVAKTANYTILAPTGTGAGQAGDGTVAADTSAGTFTFTLPLAASFGAGNVLKIPKTDTSANALTLAPTGGELIDGLTSVNLYGLVTVLLLATNVGWNVISGKQFVNPERFDVRWFGAKIDGTTNDTTAIHAARDSAGVGSTLIFPDGTALVSGLTNNVANQTWHLSAGTTISLANSSNADTVILSGNGSRLIGGIVEGNGANQSSGVGIAITGEDCLVDGTVVQNTKSYGIYAPNNNRTRILNARVIDSLSSGIFAEASSGASVDVLDIVITGCQIDRTGIAAASVVSKGIMVHGYSAGPKSAIGPVVANNIVRMPTNPTASGVICIEVFGLSPYSKITGNSCFGGTMGISVDDSDFTSITANPIFGPKSTGIELAGSQFCSVTANPIDGNDLTASGIICSNVTTGYNAINGNPITRVTSRGIKLQDSPFSSVTGNPIKMTAAGYAIELITSDDCTVTGNAFNGASLGLKGVMLNTSQGVAISGNSIKDFTQHGVLIFATTAVTLDDISIVANSIDNCNVFVGTSLSGGAVLGANCRVQANGGTNPEWLDLKNDIKVLILTGSPEGVHTAGVGSEFIRTDGGASTTRYLKQAGTGNTGWRPVSTYLIGSETKDWGSVAVGASLTEAVTVTGAALGDLADASMSVDLQGMQLTAHVSATDTVTCVISNMTASAVDLGSGTLRAVVMEVV